MLIKFFFLLILSFVFASVVDAALGPRTASDLLTICEAAINFQDSSSSAQGAISPVDAGYCYGYLQGYNDMHDVSAFFLTKIPNNPHELQKNKIYCIPDNITISQVSRMVVKYLKTNPKELSNPARIVLLKMYSKFFPCKQGEKRNVGI